MILLLGGSGYIGQAFRRELEKRGWPFVTATRKHVNYARFDVLLSHLQKTKPSLVINAAGYTGSPNVDACEAARADTLLANALLPQTIAQACSLFGTPLAHVSTGCIFTGAKLFKDGILKVERDLSSPEFKSSYKRFPQSVRGFTEDDVPNFTFRQPLCSFYSGTKALAEELISNCPTTYIWRLRIPFDEHDNARNYLSKIQRYSKVYDNINSLSHRGDFARACLDLWERQAPFGTYNMTNPGFVTTREVVQMIVQTLKPAREFEFWADDEEFYRVAAKAPRSNCILDVSKLLAHGVRLRPVTEALQDALNNWSPEK